jgi:hypothetical protein
LAELVAALEDSAVRFAQIEQFQEKYLGRFYLSVTAVHEAVDKAIAKAKSHLKQ